MFVGGSGLSPWVWGGFGSRLKGSPRSAPLSPYEGPPAGSGIPERAGKRLRPIGASSQELFNPWATPPGGLDKRTNLPANHFGSSSPFCPAACSGFEFTRPPPYSKLPSDAGQHQVCVRCRALGCMRIALQLFVRCVCMLVSRPPQFLRVRRLRTWCVRGFVGIKSSA